MPSASWAGRRVRAPGNVLARLFSDRYAVWGLRLWASVVIHARGPRAGSRQSARVGSRSTIGSLVVVAYATLRPPDLKPFGAYCCWDFVPVRQGLMNFLAPNSPCTAALAMCTLLDLRSKPAALDVSLAVLSSSVDSHPSGSAKRSFMVTGRLMVRVCPRCGGRRRGASPSGALEACRRCRRVWRGAGNRAAIFLVGRVAKFFFHLAKLETGLSLQKRPSPAAGHLHAPHLALVILQ